MDFLKTVTGKVVSGLVGLAVIAAAISWFQMTTETRHWLLAGTGKIFSWMGIVLIVPWATFFVIGRVGKIDSNSNLPGALLVGAYTVIEAIVLAWLFGWHIPSGTAWTFFILGGLFAAVYNLFTCDWIAEKV
jgi:FtsH-binding integral membrane protein